MVEGPSGSAPGSFPPTSWGVVHAAAHSPTVESREALAALCEAYWRPLYCYIRRRGHSADEAQDLTQDFFARLLEKNYLKVVDREKGKFRLFLLASVKHFLSNELDRLRAQKRGGGKPPISLDLPQAERRYARELSGAVTPETIFEKQWAVTLLERVLERLRGEFSSGEKLAHFDRLKAFLGWDETRVPYREVAAELEMTEGAVKVAVHRLRRRYRDLLRAEIGETVSDPGEVDAELRYLFRAIGG